jgi:hypothetical protein
LLVVTAAATGEPCRFIVRVATDAFEDAAGGGDTPSLSGTVDDSGAFLAAAAAWAADSGGAFNTGALGDGGVVGGAGAGGETHPPNSMSSPQTAVWTFGRCIVSGVAATLH